MGGNKIKKLPEGWRWEKIEQLGMLSQGGTPGKDVPEYWDGKFPFVTGADITELHVSRARSFLTEEGLYSGKTQKCEKGDLLIVSRTRVGRIGIAATTLGVSQDVSVLKVNGCCDAKYLAIFLKSIARQLEDSCRGATIKGLTRDYIENISIPFPPTLDDQIMIASELERKMAEVETMRQAALRQKEAAAAMSSAVLSEIFSCDIFKDFELVRLEDWACSVASGQAVSSVGGTYQERGIRYIQGKNLTNEGFAIDPAVYIGMETHAAMSRSVVKPKDVLINIVGPPIGKICWYPEGQPEANTNQAIVRVHCPDDLDHRFLTYLLRTMEYYNYFFEVKVGVRQWNISRTNCADIRIPRVPLSLQHDLVKKFEEKMAGNLLVHAMEQQLEAIEALPGAILREVFDFEEDN